jgi:TonB-linked SusC/RagA family outer membrane protein
MRKLFLILITVLTCSWAAIAQTRAIHGTVLDAANNEPLIGATIMPIGGGQGTQADVDGNFTIHVPANVTKATFSYVGYTSKTLELKNDMVVYLASTSTTLDDVVVVAYGTATKESLTGSVSVVGSKEIEDRPITSVTAALEGNAPGVQVNNTYGTPGSTPEIRVRGFSSVTSDAANRPVYVVDGVPYLGDIASLNPSDIESMTVLKDAASAALYGNQGANGVILITTKKAKVVGKPEVSLTISQGLYTRGISRYDRLGANQWMEQVWQGAYNQQVSLGTYAQESIPTFLQNNIMSSTYIPVNIYGVSGENLFDLNGKILANPLSQYNDTDWWDAVSRTGHRQEYNINASAASEKYNVFASLGYLKEQGYLLKTDLERYTGRVNTNFQPTSYFKFGLNLAGNVQKQNFNDNAGDSTSENPFLVDGYAPVYPYYSHDAETNDVIVNSTTGKPEWNMASYLKNSNLAYSLRQNFAEYSSYNIDGSAYGTIILPYNFDVTVRANMYRDKSTYIYYMNDKIGSQAGSGALEEDFYDSRYYTFQQMLNWSHEYGLHHVDALLVHENFQNYTNYSYATKNDQTFDNIYSFSNFSTIGYVSGGIGEERSEGYMARGRYNWNQKYFAEAQVRRDGSSRFSKDNRWGTFWSVGASWILSKENFMHSLEWLDYAKLRAGYGTVGNKAAASNYGYYSTYSQTTYMGSPALLLATLEPTSLKWETTKTFDIALEGNVFNRLDFSIGYFDKRSCDLIFSVGKPLSVGQYSNYWGSLPTVKSNIGTMSNRGWELSFGVDILRNKDFTWRASVDATFLKNKVVTLPDHKDITVSTLYRRAEGRSIYEYYTYHYAGVDQLTGNALYELDPNAYEFTYQGETGQEVFESRLEEARSEGKLVEINGKYYVTDTTLASKDWRGSAIPTVYGSFGTSFSWKGLNLSMLFTYSLGGKTYDSNYKSLMTASDPNSIGSAYHKDVLNSWNGAPEGMTVDSPNRIDPNGIPQFNYYTSPQNNDTSDRWLTSSDYLVFKNLSISYDLPKKWVMPLQMQNINIGFSVDNLFTIAARKGLNPQYTFSGSQSQDFVTARVFTFTLNAKF